MAKNKKIKRRQSGGARSQQAKTHMKPIPLTEYEHFKIQYRPRLIKTAAIFLLLLIPIIFVFSLFAIYHAPHSTHNNVVFLLGFFLCFSSILGWPMAMALYKLPGEDFACFCFMKYFLRLKESYLVIASYSGDCPLCNTKLNLLFNFPGSLMKKDSYFAKCHGKPEHTFPPDKLHLFVERGDDSHQ